MVWLHGYGDGPEGWAHSFEVYRATHPKWKWVHLRAPRVPQTCAGGRKIPSWGDYHEDVCTTVGSRDYDNQDIVSGGTLAEVHRCINELETCDGVSPEHVIVGGFSMGATAAAETALRYPRRLAGLVMLNGWLLPGARRVLRESPGQGMHVLVSHGSLDDQVGFDCGELAAKTLKEAGASVRFEVQQGLRHVDSGFGPGCDLAIQFFEDVLGSCSQRKP